MPCSNLYILKWNIELLQVFIFELVQLIYILSVFIPTVQIQGYIARLFSIEIDRKIFINKTEILLRVALNTIPSKKTSNRNASLNGMNHRFMSCAVVSH